MEFKEVLPAQCPPSEAGLPENEELGYRLLELGAVSDDDFKSHQELKPHIVYPDPCRFRSVSLVRSYLQCREIIKIKRMKKFRFAAELKLQSDSGIVERDSEDHMNWWLSKDCEHDKLITQVREL
jgi:hypothetical protein